MEVFHHHLYEYKKGLRNLILHTAKIDQKEMIEKRLHDKNIPYVIYKVNKDKINVFFGNKYCVNIIQEIGKSSLTDYTDEEDFILGIMLGYNRLEQCKRYMKRKSATEGVESLV